jgi:putative endonuclease
MKHPCVYILASKRNGTLYVGVTSNLAQRIWQHKEGLAEGFTKDHNVKLLVWYEQHATMESAISREKALKEWRRAWKCELIEETNPYWRDLYELLI